jgi:putative ABC transport system permease protein
MLTITLRDLQYRMRQFAIAIMGAGLVFALALLLTGVRAGFDTETENTVGAIGADGWLVQEGVAGPFTSVSGLAASTAPRIAAIDGVEKADPFVALPNSVRREDGSLVNVNVVGIVPGGVGAPTPSDGDPLQARGQAVVDSKTELEVGDSFTIADKKFEMVGGVSDRTYFGGQPVVYMPIADAQDLAFDGRPLANAVVFTGDLTRVPKGLIELSNDTVQGDMKRVLHGAIDAIELLRALMWLVAAVIIGAVVYLSALERLTDFAVLKAVGGQSRSLAVGLAVQAMLASLLAAALAVGFAAVLRPQFPLPITIGVDSYVKLVLIATVVGILSSLAALRRVLKVDPALAFG